MQIRYINQSDSRLAVSNVYEKSWKYAYRGIVSQDYLDDIPTGQWASGIEQDGRKNIVLIENGIIIGTSGFGSARMEDMKGFGEIISLYLLPEYIGKGYGRQLLQFAMKELQKMGFHKVYLWVLEENKTARHFYEKSGFVPTGRCLTCEIGGRECREIQYEKGGETGDDSERVGAF